MQTVLFVTTAYRSWDMQHTSDITQSYSLSKGTWRKEASRLESLHALIYFLIRISYNDAVSS
jgi:hypothetical protein